jgi:hypothetical protein
MLQVWLTSYKIFSQAYVLCIQGANILNINTDNKIIAGYQGVIASHM